MDPDKTSDEALHRKADEMQYDAGRRDGEAGHGPAMASKSYLEGYMVGRRGLQAQRARDGLCPTCGR